MIGVLEPELTKRFYFSQTQFSLLETCTQVGLYCGITQGFFFDKYGSRYALWLAGTLLMTGYISLFLITKSQSTPPVGFLAVIFFIIGQGSHGLYSPSVKINVLNFSPKHRGIIMGLLSAGFGLSGAIFTKISTLFESSSVLKFENEVCGRGHLVTPGAIVPTITSTSFTSSTLIVYTSSEQPPIYGPMYFFLFTSIVLTVCALIGSYVIRQIPLLPVVTKKQEWILLNDMSQPIYDSSHAHTGVDFDGHQELEHQTINLLQEEADIENLNIADTTVLLLSKYFMFRYIIFILLLSDRHKNYVFNIS